MFIDRLRIKIENKVNCMKIRISKDTAIVTVLSLVFVLLSMTSLARKSPTCDEVAHHVPAGYVFLKTGDFGYSPDAPPLPRYLASFPMIFMNLDLPDDPGFWRRDDRSEFSREFLFELNRKHFNRIMLYARIPMVLLGLFGGWFFFFWVRKHYGGGIATLGSMFYFLSPNILAHARLATTDIAAGVFIMCSVFTFWDFVSKKSMGTLLAAAFFLALAMMSKFSALLLIPIFGFIVIVTVLKKLFTERTFDYRIFAKFSLLIILAVFVLWAGYGFEYKPFLQGAMRPEAKIAYFSEAIKNISPVLADKVTEKTLNFLYTVPVPLSSFVLGLIGVIKHGGEGSATYFMGSWSHQGNPFYYLLAFLIKTPVPVILCFFFGLISVYRKRRNVAKETYLLSIICIFVIMASRSNLQLGLRYILPVYPFVFVIAAMGMYMLFDENRISRMFSKLLVVWLCLAAVFTWPDYLSYFNELIGGPSEGYRYLRDSNIDWGQDLPALKEYMKENGVETIGLDYFGEGSPEYYGISCVNLAQDTARSPDIDVYAISVHYMDRYPWAFKRSPDAMAGYSINIYDFREKK